MTVEELAQELVKLCQEGKKDWEIVAVLETTGGRNEIKPTEVLAEPAWEQVCLYAI